MAEIRRITRNQRDLDTFTSSFDFRSLYPQIIIGQEVAKCVHQIFNIYRHHYPSRCPRCETQFIIEGYTVIKQQYGKLHYWHDCKNNPTTYAGAGLIKSTLQCNQCGIIFFAIGIHPLINTFNNLKKLSYLCKAVFVRRDIWKEEAKHQYYLRVWGWDYKKSRKTGSIDGTPAFCYEQFYYLTCDPSLHNMQIGGHVKFDRFSNRIGQMSITFRSKNGREAHVSCTHTIINHNNEQITDDTQLSPEEHFVALRSYVAGIAEIGIERMFRTYYNEEWNLPAIGFNADMQSQIIRAVCSLLYPDNTKMDFIYFITESILNHATATWLASRINACLLPLDIRYTLLSDQEFIGALDETSQQKVKEIRQKLSKSTVKDVERAEGIDSDFDDGIDP